MTKRILVALCLMLQAQVSFAQAPEAQPQSYSERSGQTRKNRPPALLLGHVPYVEQAGQAQLTLTGIGFDSDFRTDFLGAAFLDYGVTDRLQVTAAARYVNTETGAGLGRTQIGAQYNLLGETKPFILSLSVDVLLPTQDEDLDDTDHDRIIYQPRVLAGKDLGDLTLYGTISPAFADGREPVWHVTTAATYNVQKLVGILELVGQEGAARDPFYLVPGVIYPIAQRVNLIAGAPIGVNDDAADWAGILKVVVALP